MPTIKTIFQKFSRLAGWFPRSVALALENRRQRTAQDDLEAERLDRIRNPSKYRGK